MLADVSNRDAAFVDDREQSENQDQDQDQDPDQDSDQDQGPRTKDQGLRTED